jgi:methionyl-tRNA formyltransferase
MGRSMKIAFLGTSEFAVPSLRKLLSETSVSIDCVVTQEDRPRDRGHRPQPTPVKAAALEHGIPVFQPLRIRHEESKAFFQELCPELIIVVSYGQILPGWLLELPMHGAINVHASLLPRYRGAAPIQWTVINGETGTGITTMLMDEGLDTGPILLQRATDVGPNETAGELHDRLAAMGADLLLDTLHRLQQGSLVIKPQAHDQATLAPKISKDQARIDWSIPAGRIHNLVRAFNPVPGAFSRIRNTDLKIWKSLPWTSGDQEPCPALQPGEIRIGRKNRPLVGCGDGLPLELVEISQPSRKRITGAELVNGLKLQSGEFFETAIRP